eukprot:9093017-Pyramimonas_sp.AAC.1
MLEAHAAAAANLARPRPAVPEGDGADLDDDDEFDKLGKATAEGSDACGAAAGEGAGPQQAEMFGASKRNLAEQLAIMAWEGKRG